MFRHVVLMRWNHELTPEELAQVVAVHDALGSKAPTVRSFSHGPDLHVRPNGYDYGLVADFDDADGWRAYGKHPAHDDVRAVVRSITDHVWAVQFEVTDIRRASPAIPRDEF